MENGSSLEVAYQENKSIIILYKKKTDLRLSPLMIVIGRFEWTCKIGLAHDMAR